MDNEGAKDQLTFAAYFNNVFFRYLPHTTSGLALGAKPYTMPVMVNMVTK